MHYENNRCPGMFKSVFILYNNFYVVSSDKLPWCTALLRLHVTRGFVSSPNCHLLDVLSQAGYQPYSKPQFVTYKTETPRVHAA